MATLKSISDLSLLMDDTYGRPKSSAYPTEVEGGNGGSTHPDLCIQPVVVLDDRSLPHDNLLFRTWDRIHSCMALQDTQRCSYSPVKAKEEGRYTPHTHTAHQLKT